MKNKRLKFTKHTSLLFIFIILAISLVSCSNFDKSTYIEESLLKASNYISDREYNKALEIYEQNLQIDPLNIKTLYNKALVLNYLNKTDQALETVNILINHYPYNIKAYQLKIDIYSKLNDSDKVINTYDSLLETNPSLYSIRADFITYLLSINENKAYNALIKENAIYLLERNIQPLVALKALCTIEKNNAEYSALLLFHDENYWKEIYTQNIDN